MRYLIRSAIGLLIYIIVALLLHSIAYKSSLSIAEYRGLITSLPARLGEPTSRYELDRVQQTLSDISIGADVGLSFDSKPLQFYLGEDKFDIGSTIDLLRDGRVRPAKLKLELLLTKVDRAYAKHRRVSKYLAYLGLILLGFFVLLVLIMWNKARSKWQNEIMVSDIEYQSFADELEAYLLATSEEEVTFTGNRAELKCVGLQQIPEHLENIVKKLAENFVRNSIEHGGSKPEQRLLAGKSDFISIRVSFQVEGEYYVLCAWDNGAGLNTELIVNQAKLAGVVASSVLDAMPELQRTKLIFFKGVSTRSKTNSMAETDLALDELRAFVKPYSGVFSIHNQAGVSFQISVKLPKTTPDQS
jgi:hypothetical protein